MYCHAMFWLVVLCSAALQKLIDLKLKLQPHAVGLNGCGNLPDNASNIAWVGSETGVAPYPLWDAQVSLALPSTVHPNWWTSRFFCTTSEHIYCGANLLHH